MKKIIAITLILTAFSLPALADTIIFKDGMRVEASEIWKEGGEVRCRIGDIVFGYPKDEVARIEKGHQGSKKTAAPVLKVHKKVTATPQKKTAARKKETAGLNKRAGVSGKAKVPAKKESAAPQKQIMTPKQKAVVSKKQKPVPQMKAKATKKAKAVPKKEAPVSGKTKAVSQKAVPIPENKKGTPAKVIPAAKKKKAPKVIEPKYASIPAFKVLINEDDSNPPVYIKRRRVLLVSRGLPKAQIRALLLSYEKKIRNELKVKNARYKQILVWVYDDFKRADEGAGGWVGMITNDLKSGQLSDNPVMSLK